MGDFDFDSIIDAFVDGEQEQRTREIGNFWATDLGKCRRQVYYTFTLPKSYKGAKLRIFKSGSIIHEYLQKVAKAQEGKAFKVVWSERYMKVTDTETDLNITGKIDLFFVPNSGEPFVVEFKSMNERAFAYNQKPYHSHRCQLNIYLRSERARYGYIIYINKSDMSLHTFRVDYDENLFHQSLSEMRKLLINLRNSSLPAKTNAENWECDYCLFQAECSRNDNPALHKRLFPSEQQPLNQVVTGA